MPVSKDIYEALNIPEQRQAYLESIMDKIESVCRDWNLSLTDTVKLIEKELDINRQETILIGMVLGVLFTRGKKK